MPESTAADPESMGSNRGMAIPFSPDFMFSGPLFGCSGSLLQACKLDFRPGSLESGLAALEASQAACEAFQAALRLHEQPLKRLKQLVKPLKQLVNPL